MAVTKTIGTNRFGKVDIRRTTKKLEVHIDFKGENTYKRVAWEDTAACYWVKVDGFWYRLDGEIDGVFVADKHTIGYNN